MRSISIYSWAAGFSLALIIVAGKWGLSVGGFDAYKFEIRYAATMLLIPASFLYGRGKLKKHKLKNSVKWSLCTLFIYLMLAVFWSYMEDTSTTKLLDLMFLSVVMLIIVSSGISIQYEFNFAFWTSVLIFAGFLSLLGHQQNTELERLSTLGGGSITFARIMALGIFASYFLFYDKFRMAFYCGIIYFAVFISLSGARGVMLAVLVPLVLIVISDRRVKTVLSLLIIFGLAMVYLPTLPIVDNVISMLERRVVELTFERGHLSGRNYIYDEAIAVWLQNPIIGAGLGSFEFRRFTYAHNVFLELLSEAGAIGVGVFLFYLHSVKNIFNLHLSTQDKSVAFTWLFILISAQFSGSLYDSRILFVLPLLGVSLYSRSQRVSK